MTVELGELIEGLGSFIDTDGTADKYQEFNAAFFEIDRTIEVILDLAEEVAPQELEAWEKLCDKLSDLRIDGWVEMLKVEGLTPSIIREIREIPKRTMPFVRYLKDDETCPWLLTQGVSDVRSPEALRKCSEEYLRDWKCQYVSVPPGVTTRES